MKTVAALGRCLPTVTTLRAVWMWRSTAIQCGTMHRQFLPWGDLDGYECAHESRWDDKPPLRSIPMAYGL